jgi:hypothetical protein
MDLKIPSETERVKVIPVFVENVADIQVLSVCTEGDEALSIPVRVCQVLIIHASYVLYFLQAPLTLRTGAFQ